MQDFKYNDGGRAAAGFSGGVADCVTRSLAILTGTPYTQIRDGVLRLSPDAEVVGVNIFGNDFRCYSHDLARLVYIPMRNAFFVSDFPKSARFMVLTKNHVTAIIDGVVNDVFDCRNELSRGYWTVAGSAYNVIDQDGDVKNKNGRLNLSQAEAMRDMLYLNFKIKTWII